MKTLKEVEAVKSSRSKKDIIERTFEKNNYFPYTVKKIITGAYFIDYASSCSDNDLEYLINSTEHFCHCLCNMNGINSFNISNVAMYVIAESKNIQDEILGSNNQNKRDFNDKKKIYYFKLKQVLEDININEINSELRKNNLYVDINEDIEEDLDYLNNKELETIIFELIEKYNFSFSDILMKFFLEVDLGSILNFTKGIYIKKSKYNLAVLINLLNSLIYETMKLFDKDSIFLYRMIQVYIFKPDEISRYFKIFLEEISKTKNKNLIYNRMSVYNKQILIRNFSNGLLHCKEYYLLEFSKYNNCNFGEFRKITEDLKYKYVKKISKNLENQSIFTLYELGKITDKEIGKYIEHIDKLAVDIKSKKRDVCISKQELNEEQKKLILDIVKEINELRLDYNINCVVMSNLNQIGRIITYLEFDISLSNRLYSVKIGKNNLSLIWYVHYDNKQIYRENCICVTDLHRIYLLIKDYDQTLNKKKQYDLV